MLPDEDRDWLKALNADLWRQKHRIVLEAERRLTGEEFTKLFRLIEKHKLLTEMSSKGMFGGYAMSVFAHEQYPGTGPEVLLLVTEDNLPTPSRADHVLSGVPARKKSPGVGYDDAWVLFSKYTHSEENRRWLKTYKMRKPEDRMHYDY